MNTLSRRNFINNFSIGATIGAFGNIQEGLSSFPSSSQSDFKEFSVIPTGFPNLDRLTNGFQNSNLIVFAAEQNMGSTTFALNIARKVALEENIPVVIFSPDLSKEELSNRFLISEASIDLIGSKRGHMSQVNLKNVIDAAGSLTELPIFIDDTKCISINDIHSKLKRFKEKHNLGLVIIDYFESMWLSPEFTQWDLATAENSRLLKDLAMEFNIPILVLSRIYYPLASQRLNKPPMLSDLMESGAALGQDADIFAFIHEFEYKDRKVPIVDGELVEITVAKNRNNGVTGTFAMVFDKKRLNFTDQI